MALCSTASLRDQRTDWSADPQMNIARSAVASLELRRVEHAETRATLSLAAAPWPSPSDVICAPLDDVPPRVVLLSCF